MLSSVVLALVILFYLTYRFFVYPAFFSPLSAIPNAHFSSSFSNGWMIWQRYNGQTNKAIFDAHKRLGPVVRLGLTEISVNSPEALKVVYSGNFEKDDFYAPFTNYGLPNMFSMVHRPTHTKRRRMFANIYSKSALQSSAAIHKLSQAIIMEDLLPIIDLAARESTPLNMFEYSSAIYLDFITAFVFGLQNGSNYVRDTKARKNWMATKKITNEALGAGSWASDIPVVSSLLMKLGVNLEDPRIKAAVEEGNDRCLDMVDRSETSLDSSSPISRTGDKDKDVKWTEPVVYKQLVNQLRSSAEKTAIDPLSDSQLRLTVASELMDHLVAGTETSGWTLIYIMHELSHRPYLQSSLRSALLSLSPPILYPSLARPSDSDSSPIEDLPSPQSIDNLPLLDAIIFESLRLHPPVPGQQPRVTPAHNPESPTSLLDYSNIPQGIRVSAQAYSLHRNPKVFPDSEAWKPERWLEASQEQRSEMTRWFWAFGSGGHMCIGNNLGILELKFVVAAIYSNYTTSIIDDEGIEQLDGYAVGSKGDRLILQFERA